jgi:hypothetical protein
MSHVNTGNPKQEKTAYVASLTAGMRPFVASQAIASEDEARKAKGEGPVPQPNFKTADVNCALCTAAGAVMLKTGNFMTSGDVAAELGSPSEDRELFVEWWGKQNVVEDAGCALSEPLASQVKGLYYYLKRKVQCQTDIHGSTLKLLKWPQARVWMKDQHQDGTVFAVYFRFGGEAHWLNAVRRGGKLRFIDYQTDTMYPAGRETEGDKPFVGISKTVATDRDDVLAIAFMG